MIDKNTNKSFTELSEQYKILTEGIGEGILITDFTGKVFYFNKAMVKILHGEKPEKGKQYNIFDFLAPEFRGQAIKDYFRVLNGKGGFPGEYKVKAVDGQDIWIESVGKKIFYQGKPASFNIVWDITERRLAQEKLEKGYSRLGEVVKEKTSELRESNEALKRSLERLARVLKETVNALAFAVEKRDPYTAGHQWKVSQLACAIAKKMGFSKDYVEGIYMAAIVHDVGKIYLPAEILGKPARLDELEFWMIKTHARIGHEILTPIEFPWPVAQIVLQHHERLDGSGYPNGFTGEDILIGARILAVADVVEAMAAHRPYQPALGINQALEEVNRNKGQLYDANVVGVCHSLFVVDRFLWSEQPKLNN